MKTNGNEPINLAMWRQTSDTESRIATEKDKQFGMHLHASCGLTKREYFASMAMGGILADVRSLSDASLKAVVESSVSIADLLIEELNKEEQQ
ncbi:hypothetical protein [Parapedobacter lycopersici]|uniref:hypothetical protein n=1 Tax=Parapedobacter lycopersici TaxID=1864939 RepID=UPI00214D975C|nr:hypothetical protein [Parapedobacter lycopersici]